MNALERLKKQASIEIEKGTLSHEEIMKNLKPFLLHRGFHTPLLIANMMQ